MDNKLGVVEKLLGIVRSNKANMKVRERAAAALGNLCLGDAAFTHRRMVIEKFLETASVSRIKALPKHLMSSGGNLELNVLTSLRA